MIKANHICFSFGKSPVLNDITFQLGAGKLCGILGANGSGKTTLLKCILGILPMDNGKVSIFGKSTLGLSPGKRAKLASYVPQETRQFGVGTVFETVLMGRKPHFGTFPTSYDYEKTARILAECELEGLAMRSVTSLSGGQRQRVCIAKSLCQETPVILLDEPTANLDLNYKSRIMQLLQNLTKQGKTILVSLHDLDVARAFCSDIILLKQGEIIDRGSKNILTPDNIAKLYNAKLENIAPLLSASNMNCIDSFMSIN